MPNRSRAVVALSAAGVVAAGLVVATFGRGALADPAGDALYAALLYVLMILAAPRVRPRTAALLAFGVCALVELAQLTGVPAAMVEAVPVSRFVVGTTFVPLDLLAYAVGSVLAALADVGIGRAARRSPEDLATG